MLSLLAHLDAVEGSVVVGKSPEELETLERSGCAARLQDEAAL